MGRNTGKRCGYCELRQKEKAARRTTFFERFYKTHIVVCSVIFAILIMFTTVEISCFAVENSIDWTEEELVFMEEHQVIRLGVDPGFVPFEFVDENGEYNGIAADYLALISEITGLQFEVLTASTWPEVYDMALKGEIDALPAIGKTIEKKSTSFFRTLLLL